VVAVVAVVPWDTSLADSLDYYYLYRYLDTPLVRREVLVYAFDLTHRSTRLCKHRTLQHTLHIRRSSPELQEDELDRRDLLVELLPVVAAVAEQLACRRIPWMLQQQEGILWVSMSKRRQQTPHNSEQQSVKYFACLFSPCWDYSVKDRTILSLWAKQVKRQSELGP